MLSTAAAACRRAGIQVRTIDAPVGGGGAALVVPLAHQVVGRLVSRHKSSAKLTNFPGALPAPLSPVQLGGVAEADVEVLNLGLVHRF